MANLLPRISTSNHRAGCMTVAEAGRVLRMLQSSSTPAAKKRMLMKSTFGDYRKKMADELLQIEAGKLVFTWFWLEM